MLSGDSYISIYSSDDDIEEAPREALPVNIKRLLTKILAQQNSLHKYLTKHLDDDNTDLYNIHQSLRAFTLEMKQLPPNNRIPIKDWVKKTGHLNSLIALYQPRKNELLNNLVKDLFRNLTFLTNDLIFFSNTILNDKQRPIHRGSLNEEKKIDKPRMSRPFKNTAFHGASYRQLNYRTTVSNFVPHVSAVEEKRSLFSRIKNFITTKFSSLTGFFQRKWNDLFVSSNLPYEEHEEKQNVSQSSFRSTSAILISRSNFRSIGSDTYARSPTRTSVLRCNSYLAEDVDRDEDDYAYQDPIENNPAGGRFIRKLSR